MTSVNTTSPLTDLQTSYTSDSYESDGTFLSDLQYPKGQTPTATIASTGGALSMACQTGIVYGFRTRQLSCIEENDSDSLHSTSQPQSYDFLKIADAMFQKIINQNKANNDHDHDEDSGDSASGDDDDNNNNNNNDNDDDENDDEMVMINEGRLYDSDYMDELTVSKIDDRPAYGREPCWQSTVSEPVHRVNTNAMPPDIMTTSCYGALNSAELYAELSAPAPPMYAEISTPKKHGHGQLQKCVADAAATDKHIYATPDRRRENNRSFDSSCLSPSNSLYGSLDQSISMNTSLDLSAFNMSASLSASNKSSSFLGGGGGGGQWAENLIAAGGGESGKDDFNEEDLMTTAQCINAAENDIQSIHRLLQYESHGTVCPSCSIAFDKGKRRKLIDTCGHERCYTCVFRTDQCSLCLNDSLKDDASNAQGYDTGIGGSTSTIVSPLGSPQPQLRSQIHRTTSGTLAKYVNHNRPDSLQPPEYHRQLQHHQHHNHHLGTHHSSSSSGSNHYGSVSKLPKAICANRHGSIMGMDMVGSANTYSEISASSFVTPPTRRRFFNHKHIKNAITGGGHRRTASNGSFPPIDNALSLSRTGKESNDLNTSTCSDSVITRRRRRKNVCNNVNVAAATSSGGSENRLNRLSLAGTSVYAGNLSSLVFGKIKSLWNVNSNSSETGLNQLAGNDDLNLDQNGSSRKQDDQLRTRLGLLLEPIGASASAGGPKKCKNPIMTASSSSSHNISPEHTLPNSSTSSSSVSGGNSHHLIALSSDTTAGSPMQAAVKEDVDICGKLLHTCYLTDNSNDSFPVKVRKNVSRRSARSGHAVNASKRNAIYKTALVSQSVQLALKPLFFEVPLQEPDAPYIGRKWLTRDISNILSTTETPGVLISGNPGTGKTALILQLVEHSCFGRRKDTATTGGGGGGDDDASDGIFSEANVSQDRLKALASLIVGYHFCQADSNLTCLVPDFVHSLAAQLCQAPQLISYREYLLNEPYLQDILSPKECIADAERVLRMAILEPLATLKRSGKIQVKTCIILIDGLCEAEYHRPDHGHTIATFLAKMTQHFPSWLKVIATVRTQMLEFVKGLPYTRMTLDTWSPNDQLQKDMLEYITFRINHSAAIQNNISVAGSGGGSSKEQHGPSSSSATGHMKFVGHLQTLSKGSMLYAKLILDLIESGQLVIKSASYKVLPVSLAQIFLLHFNVRFPTTCSFEKAAPILNVCLAALYPLTLDEIYYTICALRTDELISWSEFLARFKLLDGFLVKRIDNTYMFFHSSFREWLIRRDDGESTKFLCDFRLGHAAIAFRLSRLQAPLDPEQTLELGHHMLKAHIYRNCLGPQTPRDMQSYWMAAVTNSISAALGSLRNVYSPNLKVSRLILLAGASPNYRTEFMGDATLLCIAAHEGIVPMVSLLLEFGADVGHTNSQGCTPLILASMRGHCDVVRLLVAAGSSLGQTDTTQRCALVHAARMDRLNVVKYLLACDWTPRPNSQDVSLDEALQQSLIAAASQNHTTIVEDLLEMEMIHINEIEGTSGDLALTAAAHNGCVDTVAILLAQGAEVDATNKQDSNALCLAVKAGHWAVVEKLLQCGANVNGESDKKTPLMIAAEEGHLELMELLIGRGAHMECEDGEGFTALSWASLRGHHAAVKLLFEKGCNRNHTDNNGRSALDLVAYQGSASLVQYLLEQGANIEHVDVNGMRPLDRAIACRNVQVVQTFLRKGAKLGRTTWSMAIGKPEILVILLNKLLEDGNTLYRKNRFDDAAYRYQYALHKISTFENFLERNTIFLQLRTNLLLNLSRCKRKLNKLDESVELATQAILQKPSSYEGYYARAKAKIENGEFNDALADANEAMQKAAQSSVLPEVMEVLKHIQNEILTRIAKEGIHKSCPANEPLSIGRPEEILNLSQHEMTDL